MAKSNYLYKIYHSKLELEAKNHKNYPLAELI